MVACCGVCVDLVSGCVGFHRGGFGLRVVVCEFVDLCRFLG